MKPRILAIALTLFSIPTHAEVTKLGDHSLGQVLAKSKFAKGAAFGCTGNFRQEIEKGKVSGVDFTAEGKCKASDIEAQIEKDYGAKPIVSVDKSAKLWEGKTGSVMVVTAMTGSVTVKLLPPGPGAKRACFADDGFAAFWKTFKDGIDKPDAVAATFKFPVKDYDDKVVLKDAKALGKKWAAMVDADDKKEITSGKLTPTCAIDLGGIYNLRLGNSNLSFEAKQIGGKWQWVEINSQASG